MALFSKDKTIVGVDIGTSYIKVAQISHGQHHILDTYGIVNVSSHIDPHNNTVAINDTARILKTLLAQARVTTDRCVASLPNSAVFTSVIEMPDLPQKEMKSAMEFEAKKYIPLPFNEVILFWEIMEKDSASKINKVLLIAVPRQIRETYIKVFELAGLALESIEIEALALIRSLVVDPTKNSVIIDIGAKATGLNVVKGGILQLTRNLNAGGDMITDRIAQSLNISQVRAEQFKKDFGVNENSFLPDSVKPALDIIKNEVRQLLTIYQSHSLKIDEVILVGGGAQLPGILDFFKDLGVSASLGQPLHKVSYSEAAEPLLKRFSLQLPIAIGLALRTD